MPEAGSNPGVSGRPHPLLERQLRKLGLSESDPPADAAAWSGLLEAVRRSYAASDQDRALLERSIEISSHEMEEALRRALAANAALVETQGRLEAAQIELRDQAAALARATERFEAAIEGSNDGLWDWKVGTEEVWYSPRFWLQIGFAPGDEPPSTLANWSERLHPDDAGPTWAALNRHIETGSPFDVEYRLRTVAGLFRWFRARGVSQRDGAGRPVRMAGSTQDIHERKQAEEDVRASNLRFELVTRATTNVIWDWDMTADRWVWNEHFQTVFRYGEDDAGSDSASWTDRIHPQDAPAVLKSVRDVIDGTEAHWAAEYRFRRGDGSYAFVFDRGYVIRDATGRPIRMIGAMQDFTERKQAVEDLRCAKELAEGANNAKSEFLANMSHEIRTPMTAILGFADLLAEEVDTPQSVQQRREYIATIRRHGEHLLSVINDILDISKIEAGKMTVERVAVPLVQTVEEVLTLMRVRSEAKGLLLQAFYRTPLPRTVQSDPLRLRQVLINLIGNAIKFTEEGGVRLTVGIDLPCPVVQAADNGRCRHGPLLRISVHDTGIGLTQEQMSRLFGAFEQADTSMSRRFGGTGLGLRISKRLAQLLGGDVTVESIPGTGSVFTVTIATGPLEGVEMIDAPTHQVQASDIDLVSAGAAALALAAPASAAPVPVAPAPLAKPLAGVRLLLVEDGPDNQRLIAFHLKRAGAAVTIADNGLKGVRAMCVTGDEAGPLIEPSPFDVVLMDMQMPEMDGYAATMLLRSKGCGLPIVALTAHAMSGDREACMAAGCSDYATKPIDGKTLIALVTAKAGSAA